MEGKGEAGPTGSVSEGEGRQRRVKRIEVRSRLLEAAERCFAESGYEGTSLERIALAAGFSKGAVYSNFASKEELFFDLMAERVEERSLALALKIANLSVSADRAREAGHALGDLVLEDPAWQALFLEFWLRSVRNPALKAEFSERRLRLRAKLAERIEAECAAWGRNPSFSSAELATVSLALSNGFGIEGLVSPEAASPELLGRVFGLIFA
jgi:AcrR family transcriptional regulator